MRTVNRWVHRILDNHELLTAAACINLAAVAAASVFDLSDRTFYTFLIAAVLSGWLALRAANRATDAAIRHALADDPDPFGMQVRVEYRDNPTDTTGETR